jgi:hypothetical protein
VTYWFLFGYVDFKGQIILQPSDMDYSLLKSREIFTPVSMVIDPKTNTVPKVYYDYLEDGSFKEINEPKSFKDQRKKTVQRKRKKATIMFPLLEKLKKEVILP